MRAKAPAPRACADKRRYPDEGQALQFAISRPGRKPGSDPMRAYPCRGCSGWHLLSKPLQDVITAPPVQKQEKHTIPTSVRRKAKVAGKRPAAVRNKRNRATVL